MRGGGAPWRDTGAAPSPRMRRGRRGGARRASAEGPAVSWGAGGLPLSERRGSRFMFVVLWGFFCVCVLLWFFFSLKRISSPFPFLEAVPALGARLEPACPVRGGPRQAGGAGPAGERAGAA